MIRNRKSCRASGVPPAISSESRPRIVPKSPKFLINDACVMGHKLFVHAGIIRFKGQLMTYVPGEGPCYRCVFHDMPPKDAVSTCKQAGAIGAIAGVIGCLEALEAIKYISESIEACG